MPNILRQSQELLTFSKIAQVFFGIKFYTNISGFPKFYVENFLQLCMEMYLNLVEGSQHFCK